uniref:Uncharacterized protein n=1 Tax=Panagrolaimus sp. ES5 TaxID=591445 RepID=A0AC34GFH6_9BILA
MSRSLIKFNILNEKNELKKTSWLNTKNYQTLKDLKDFGFSRLKFINSTDKKFKFFEISKEGKLIELGEGEDEVTELGINYQIVDEKAIDICGNTATTSTSSEVLPTSSAVDNSSIPPLFDITDDRTLFSTPRPPKMPRLATGPAAKPPTKRDHLCYYFNRYRLTILKKFEEYKPESPLFFKNVNVYDFFNGNDLGKAAVFILRENIEPQLHDASIFVILGIVMELIGSIIPNFDLPR